MIPLLLYVLCGATGGIAWYLTAKHLWKERYELLRRIALGAIVGGAVYFIDQTGSVTAVALAFENGIASVEIVSAAWSRHARAHKRRS